MKKNLIFIFLIVLIFGIVSGLTAEAKEEDSEEYKTALAVAKALDIYIRATRELYTRNVVKKLEMEGGGADLDSDAHEGFVPLPAQFIRAVAFNIIVKQKRLKENFIEFDLRSRWNLNRNQGLQDDFEKEGWEFLARQQVGVTDLKSILWKPFVRLETIEGQKTLRYLNADTATATECVSCHNKWEKQELVKKRRKIAGVEEGKAFRLNELIGVLSIRVSLDE